MTYITFYTPGFYEEVFHKYLKPSADSFDLSIRAYKEHNYGDWGLNTRHKAKVILRALQEHGDVVWLDVDAEIVRPPSLFEKIPQTFDMAIYYLDWFKQWRGIEGESKRELVNSVMLIRNRPHIHKLLEQWIESNTTTDIWEQQVFQNLLESSTNANVFTLPDEYCAIVNHSGKVPEYVKEPVIIQHQISREIKRNKKLIER